MKRFSGYIWPVVGLLALVFCSWLLVRELRGVSIYDIWSSISDIPPLSLLACFLSTLVAYAALAWYDRIALLHLGHKLSWLFISLTSFTTYALSHNIGMSMISGGLIRYRAYSTRGLTFAEVATLVVFCSFTFALGATMLGGGVLLLDPHIVDRLIHVSPTLVWIVGFLLVSSVIFYGMGSFLHLPPIIIGSFKLVYPRPPIAIRQFFAAPLELIGAAGILYFALPADSNPGYLVVLGIFLASFSAALLSHAPGGLGVLEFVFLKAMPEVPQAQVLAALIVFRFFYLILPLLFGLCAALLFEHGHMRDALRAMRDEKTTMYSQKSKTNVHSKPIGADIA